MSHGQKEAVEPPRDADSIRRERSERIQRKTAKSLSMAAAVRTRMATQRIQKLSLSKNLNSDTKRHSAVEKTPFSDAAFMNQVKEADDLTAHDVGNEKAQLPQVPQQMDSVIKTTHSENITLESLFSESNSDISKISGEERIELFSRCVRAVLGLNTLQDADELGKEAIAVLEGAFALKVSDVDEINSTLSKSRGVARALRRDMRAREGRVASHPYYGTGEFESSEGEALWRAKESDEVDEMKREAKNFLNDPQQYKKKKHTQASAHDDDDDHPQQQNKKNKNKNQRKSQNGGRRQPKSKSKSRPWYACFSCCGGDDDKGKRNSEARRRNTEQRRREGGNKPEERRQKRGSDREQEQEHRREGDNKPEERRQKRASNQEQEREHPQGKGDAVDASRRRSLRNSVDLRSRRSLRDSAEGFKQGDSRRRQSAEDDVAVAMVGPSVEDGLCLVAVALLQYANRDSGVQIEVRLGSQVSVEENRNALWLNEVSLFIIDSYCKRFGVGESQRDLVLLDLLLRYPQISSDYFWSSLELYETLSVAGEKKLLTKRERLALERLVSFSLSWSEACLSSYHDAFAGDIAEKGLAECIRMTKLARQCSSSSSSSGGNDAVVSFSRYVDQLCEEALSKRYLYVMETAKDMAITVEERNQQQQQQQQSAVAAASSRSLQHPMEKAEAEEGLGVERVSSTMSATGVEIRNTRHLIYGMQLLQKEIDTDLAVFGPVLEYECGFNAAKETSEAYFPLIWSDFQSYMRMQEHRLREEKMRMGNQPDAFDSLMFALYAELKKLYAFFDPNLDLPDVAVGTYFAAFMDRWMEIQRAQFSSARVDAAIRADTWKPVADTKCSTSVIDVFSLLYPLDDAFKAAPFSSVHALQFARLLSDTATYYCQSVNALILQQLGQARTPRQEVEAVLVVRLNDMQVCKRKLADLLIDIDLESAYGEPPKLVDQDLLQEREQNQPPADDDAATEDIELLLNDESSGLDTSVLDLLRCTNSFKFMQDLLDAAASILADQMNPVWEALVTELLVKEPERPMSVEEVEDSLQPLWNDVSAKIEALYASSVDCRYILKAMLAWIAVDFEVHLLAESTATVLNPIQMQRCRHAMQLVRELFLYYELPENYIDDVNSVQRVLYLQQLLESDTDSLIAVWDSLPDKEEMEEDERKAAAPYISHEYLRRALALRDRAGDKTAHAFLASKKRGWW